MEGLFSRLTEYTGIHIHLAPIRSYSSLETATYKLFTNIYTVGLHDELVRPPIQWTGERSVLVQTLL